jgi:methionine-rich copper-binding protein CopC
MTPRSTGRGRTVTWFVVLLLVLASLFPAAVLAHAELETSDPADGSTVEVAPTEIVMTFTQDLDPSQSSIVVVAGGTQIATGGEIDAAEPRRMTLALPPLEPGAFEVRWTSRSAEDGELVRGVTTFTYAPAPTPSPSPTSAPSATPAPTPPPTPSPSPTASPAPSPSADTTPTSSTADILLPIVVAILVIAGLGYWLLRRRSGAGGTP